MMRLMRYFGKVVLDRGKLWVPVILLSISSDLENHKDFGQSLSVSRSWRA